MEIRKKSLIHKKELELKKARKKGKTSGIFLSKNCKLYGATEISELETGATPGLKQKS